MGRSSVLCYRASVRVGPNKGQWSICPETLESIKSRGRSQNPLSDCKNCA